MKPGFHPRLATALAAWTVSASMAWAQTHIVESRAGGQHFNLYSEVGTWANSGAKSTAPGVTPGIGSRFGSTAGPDGAATYRFTPTVPGNYEVAVTLPSTSNVHADGVDYFISNDGATVQVLGFNQNNGGGGANNAWAVLATVPLTAGNEYTVVQQGVAVSFVTQRSDAVRWLNTSDPCVGVPAIARVTGPLADGQMTVDVPDVDAAATVVTVYEGLGPYNQIGQLSAGVIAGTNTVPLTQPLDKGQIITATQSIGGVESCEQTSGAIVGSGANVTLRLALVIGETTVTDPIVGPIGSDGGSATRPLEYLGADGQVGGFASAPTNAKLITPDLCWQTLTFERGPDPQNPVDDVFTFANGDGVLTGDFGLINSLAFAINEPDSGPYEVFIDNITNGTTHIQGWEAADVDDLAVTFTNPSFSGTTNGFLLLPTPNLSIVTDAFADTGLHAQRTFWQFLGEGNAQYLRLFAGGSGVPRPVVDLRLPISVRLLVLPIGQTPGAGPNITDQPDNVTVSIDDDAMFSVTANGTGTLSYQWLVNGAPVGTDGPNLTLPDVQAADSGSTVAVRVCDDTGSTLSDEVTLTVLTCNDPFADIDGDGDVDQEDWGKHQACITGIAGGLLQGCSCVDRDSGGTGDGDVDGDDTAAFEACASGPTLPANPACDG